MLQSIKKAVGKTLYMINSEPTRGMMKYVKHNMSGLLIGAEVGVDRGIHALEIINTIPNVYKLYLVDIEKRINEHQFNKRKVRFIHSNSVAASLRLIKGHVMLDFVYIDADHNYDSVLQDIGCWFPLVKKGGVIGGHDFNGGFPGVCKAVLDFTDSRGRPLMGQGSDWWFIK